MFSVLSKTVSRPCLFRTYCITKVSSHRSLHMCTNGTKCGIAGSYNTQRLSRSHPMVLTTLLVRYESTGKTNSTSLENPPATSAARQSDPLDQIPEPPTPVVEALPDPALLTNALGEPTFASLGLGGGFWPSGWMQSLFELLHVNCNLPWWAVISLTTVVIRFMIFPLVVRSQRSTAKMQKYMPQIQHLQEKLTEARLLGDYLEVARYGSELQLFMKEKGVGAFQAAVVPLVQAPIFTSVFFALRGMAKAPVESMREGGLWWFTDLTVADPTYMLPLITSSTLLLTIYVGTDAVRLQTMGNMKYALYVIPFIAFPFVTTFPAAVAWYWTTTNCISLVQTGIFRIPQVKSYFNIESPPVMPPQSKKNFVDNMKESWSNMKLVNQLNARSEINETQFMRAGRGPIQKTFKFNPLEEKKISSNQIYAKKR